MQRWVRTVAATAAAMLALALAAGCTPTPEPTPTPTGFASDAEAFRAAEETYRAYVDALNQVDLADPKTFEPVFAWTTGDANRAARKSFTEMHANGWTVEGLSLPLLVELRAFDRSSQTVSLSVCLNVSDVQLRDAAGESVVAADRRDVQSMAVDMARASAADPELLLISKIDGREGDPECPSG